ncbi:MAG: cupin [Chloroflexi bacterium]|nr:MAG: cupin [Chloroflexota bacterium]
MQENIIHVEKWPHAHKPTEQELRDLMLQENLEPYTWSNHPLDVYAAHTYDYHKVVYVVEGSIIFGFPIEAEPTVLKPGDRLELPAGVRHNAAVGAEGVLCLEARR